MAIALYAVNCSLTGFPVVEYSNSICDAELNNADCQWDGGDCCASTCVFNRLLYGQGSCAIFDCRDPAVSHEPFDALTQCLIAQHHGSMRVSVP